MTLDLKAIRATAEAAPKDMLHVRHDFGAYYSLRHYPGDYYQGRVRGKERADFIAIANPATVIALLDRLEAAEKEIQLVRNAALEEAAQVCDLECDNWANERPLRLCANLIRSLKS